MFKYSLKLLKRGSFVQSESGQYYYSFTCTLLQHYDDTLAVGCRLHTYSLLVHQPIEAERVPGLQVVGLLSQNKDIQITGMHLFNYLA